MLTIRYFDIITESTSTAITIAPAAEIVMIFGEKEMVLGTFIDYTNRKTLRLCHVIGMVA